MYKLIFFDTETTGTMNHDRLIQLAYKVGDEIFNKLYNPGVKIPPEASAVHHITNKMIADMPSFEESGDLPKVKELFEDELSVVIAHNAVFDLGMVEKEGVMPKNYICTLKVARALDTDSKLDNYKLQYLRYKLDMDIDGAAHDALGDVLVMEELFNRLVKKLTDTGLTEQEAIEKMIVISGEPSILRTFNFGKYAGKKIEDVCKTDRGYLEWLLKEKEKKSEGEEDWIYTLKHFLNA